MNLADEVRNLLRAVDEHWECFPPIDGELAAVRAALDRHTAAVAAAERLAEACRLTADVEHMGEAEIARESARDALAVWKAAKE